MNWNCYISETNFSFVKVYINCSVIKSKVASIPKHHVMKMSESGGKHTCILNFSNRLS
jgi:hypothetical protein